MAYENLCMYCFEDMGGDSVCPHCGRDSRAAVPQIQMLPGTLVYHDRFLIGRALGQDATGIVYSAFDTKRENKLRLREYLPRDCAERLNDGSVVPIAGLEDQFDAGLKRLRASVEGVEDPRKRHFFFEENGTAYIAQRKNAAAAGGRGRHDDEDEPENNTRRTLLIVGVAAAVVLIAAIVIISLVNGALNTSKDITQNPTLNPDQVWVPAQTPTPTPYVTPTFAALVDPDLSWMDYTYKGDVEDDFDKQNENATVTAKPSVPSGNSGYTTVSGKSSASEIKALQQKLVTLGWLDYSKINGKYDSDTKQAVKDLQAYINSAYDPDTKLTVDGIAGPKTLQWLDATKAARPTASPTPAITPDPEKELTVDKNSSKEDIRAVQRKLIFLGVMPKGSDDGKYGASTATAVKQFQKRVNKLQGYEVLEESGVVDPLTMAFLNYYVEYWEENKPSEEQPEQIPDETGDNINANSPKESIRRVQQLLIDLGMLPAGSDDGKYGSATVAAVAEFQEWVNKQLGKNKLSVSGEVDPLTREYLEYCVDHEMLPKGTPVPDDEWVTPEPEEDEWVTPEPTEEPTPVPTEEPTPEPTEEPTPEPTEEPVEEEPNEGGGNSVTPESPKESIRFVQSMLTQTGFMEEGGVDGVYGNGTKKAVAKFQAWVNEKKGREELEVTGICDSNTLTYLEYCFDHEMYYDGEAGAPTPEPTQEPVDEPEDIPTDEPQIGAVSNVSITIGGQEAGDGVVRVSKGNISFKWSAEGDVDSYYVYVEDSDGGSIISEEAVPNTGFKVDSSRMAPGEVYTLTVGVLPVNGDEEDMVWRSVQFMLPGEAPEEKPEEPEDEPEEEPTPKPAPEVGVIDELSISVDGISAGGSVIVVSADSFRVSWDAGDQVQAYSYQVKDENGATIVQKNNTTDTGITAKASAMQPGMVYTITVAAMPVNGTNDDMVIRMAKFMLEKVEITPEPTEEPTPTPEPTAEPTPVPTPAAIGKPSIVIDGSAYQEGGVSFMTGNSITIGWNAEGDVEYYEVYVENQSGERESLGATTDTSKTLPTGSLPAGIYTVFVGAMPENGSSEDMLWNSRSFGIPAPTPEPTEEPTPAPTEVPEEEPEPDPTQAPGVTFDQPVDGSADYDTILKIQMRLYSLGLLDTNGLEEGVLDKKTLRAIADFQTKVNEIEEAGLFVIDPNDPASVIDLDTLNWLFNV